MGKLSRTKGAAFEREIARRFRDLFPEAARTLTETRDGNVGDLVNVGRFCAQLKVGKSLRPWAALLEARQAAGDQMIPIAILKRDRDHPVVLLSLDDFLALVESKTRAAAEIQEP